MLAPDSSPQDGWLCTGRYEVYQAPESLPRKTHTANWLHIENETGTEGCSICSHSIGVRQSVESGHSNPRRVADFPGRKCCDNRQMLRRARLRTQFPSPHGARQNRSPNIELLAVASPEDAESRAGTEEVTRSLRRRAPTQPGP